MADDGTSADPRQRYLRRWKTLRDEVESRQWIAHWRDISDYLFPRKGRYLFTDDSNEANKGDKLNSKIINGSPCDALRTLAAGLQGGLTSPSRPWFSLAVPDEALMEYEPVKLWLHQVRQSMLHVFQKSNFYGAIHSMYEELASFGTAAMLIEEDYKTVIRCRPFTIGEYVLAQGSDYRPNALYMRAHWTARQLVSEFGIGNVSDAVRSAYETGRSDIPEHAVLRVIQPRTDRNPAILGSEGMPYESVYLEEKGAPGQFLRKGGYRGMPFVAPRWSVTGTDVYGRSPAMDALGDVKMLQKIEEKKLRALDKMVDPPLNVPTGLKGKAITTVAGGVNYVDVTAGQSGITPTFQLQPDLRNIAYEVTQVEARIKKHFFNDLFLSLLLNEKTMTAREVSERHDEKMLMIGPILERLQSELLDVVIDRAFSIMSNLNLFPPPPQELAGMEVKVEYISLLAQAQKLIGTSTVDQLMAFTMSLAQANPEVLDKIDMDETVDQYGAMLGVPPHVVRSDDDVAALRAQRQQAQAAAQAQMQAVQMAESAKTMSETQMGKDSALDRVMQGVTQQ